MFEICEEHSNLLSSFLVLTGCHDVKDDGKDELAANHLDQKDNPIKPADLTAGAAKGGIAASSALAFGDLSHAEDADYHVL